MSKENIKVVQIDTNPATKSLKDLRNELKGFKDEMANLEEGSDAFLEVANKAGEVKHQIDEINESIKGASADFGDMIGNVTNVAAGITGAFQAVAGGLQAMGVESKAIDEAIVKMQGLMAVTQGLSAIDDGIKSLDKLAASITSTSKAAKVLKTVLQPKVFLAITAVIIGITAAWNKWGDSIRKSMPLLDNFLKKFDGSAARDAERLAEAQKKFNEELAVSNEEVAKILEQRKLDLLTPEAQEKIKTYREDIKILENQLLKLQEKMNNTDVRTIWEKYRDEGLVVQEQIKQIKDDIDDLFTNPKYKKPKDSGISHTLTPESSGSTVGDVVNNAYDIFREKQSDREAQYRLYLKDLENELLQLKNEEEKIVNKYEVDRTSTVGGVEGLFKVTDKSEVDKKLDYEQGILDLTEVLVVKGKILEVEDKITESIRNRIVATELELKNYEKDSEEYKELQGTLQDLNSDLLQQEQHVNKLEQSYGELAVEIEKTGRIAAFKELLEWSEAVNEQFDILKHTIRLFGESSLGMSDMWGSAIADMQSMFNTLVETVIKGGEDSWQGYAQAASMGLQAVGTMLNAMSDDVNTNTKEGFEQQKKLQIGATVMNMLSGIMAAWTSSMALPAPASFILGAINTAATAALGAAQIAKIKNAKFGDNGANVSSSAVGGMIMPPVHYSSAVQGASTEGTIHNTKVYVTETDIKKTIQKVNVQESENTY